MPAPTPTRAATLPPIPPRRPRQSVARRHWGKLLLLAVLVVPAAVLGIWAAVALRFSYSNGERVGYNQKLSRKGWVCKTWEGELALSNVPGQAPELFRYSVRDDAVAQRIQQLAGQRVQLTYEQHVGVPTRCFGETEYFATAVASVADPYMPGMPTAPAAGASAPGTAAPGTAAPGTGGALPAPAPQAPAAPPPATTPGAAPAAPAAPPTSPTPR